MTNQENDGKGKGPKVVDGGTAEFGEGTARPDNLTGSAQPPATNHAGLYSTGLEFVAQTAAIDRFVEVVVETLCIPSELGRFAAYFGSVVQYKSDFKRFANFLIPNEVKGYDILEAHRMIFGNNGLTDDILMNLYGDKTLENENIITIDLSIFPEYDNLQNYCRASEIEHGNHPYFELMLMPQRARTFYAGLLHEKESNGKGLEKIFDFQKPKFEKPLLPLTTLEIIAYAQNHHVNDCIRYLRYLKGEK